jgi:hypothetical protein
MLKRADSKIKKSAKTCGGEKWEGGSVNLISMQPILLRQPTIFTAGEINFTNYEKNVSLFSKFISVFSFYLPTYGSLILSYFTYLFSCLFSFGLLFRFIYPFVSHILSVCLSYLCLSSSRWKKFSHLSTYTFGFERVHIGNLSQCKREGKLSQCFVRVPVWERKKGPPFLVKF